MRAAATAAALSVFAGLADAASVNAALNPGQTDYMYYALDTESGTHQFFTTYEEFEAFTATQDYTGGAGE